MLRKWFARLPGLYQIPSRRDRRSARATPPSRPRLRVDPLEDRTVPATVTWDGGGGNFDWNTAANWSADVLPGASDDVVIDLGSNNFAVTHSAGDTAIQSLRNLASLRLVGGTLDIAAASSVAKDLFLTSTLSGSGNLSIGGEFAWSGGAMTGAGTTTVLAGGTLTGTGGHLRLSGRTLANAGTGSWNSQRFILSNGAAVVNSGSFAIGSLDMYGEAGGGSFTNTTTGSITKTANASTAYIYDGVGFSNAGSVQVGNGTLWIDTPGTSSGSFDGAVNTTLVLYQQNLTATSRVSSAGTVGLTGTTVAGSYAVTGATDTGAVDFTGTVSSVGKLTVSGTTDFHGIAVSPSDLYLTGTLQSNAPITVAGTFAWSGGAMTGAGTTTVLAGGTLTGTGGHLRLSGRTLANAGTGSWNSQRFILSNGAAVVNSGSFAIGSLDMYGEAGGGSFTNTTTGSITKTANASTAYIYDGVGFSNAGSVQVGNGTLWIDTPGTSSGSFDGAVNTTLVLYQQNLTATSRVSSAGTVGLTGTTVAGSYAVTGATDTGAVDFTGTVSSVGKLTVSGTTDFHGIAVSPSDLYLTGTLQSNAPITVAGTFAWSGGAMTGAGTTTVLAGGTLTGTGGHLRLSGRTLANAGTGSWNSQRFILSNGAAVVNSGSFAIGSLDMYGEAGGGSFTNTTTGSITKTANASTAYIYDGVGFSNAGSVQVGNGTLWIDTPGTSSGSFDGAVNTTLVLYQQNLTATSRVSSAGTVGLTGTTVAGSYAVTGATDTGAVDFTGTVSSVGKLTVSGTTDFHGIAVSPSDLYLTGTLQSNAPITVAGTFAWSGGAMTGAGTTTVLAGGTLTGTGGHLRLSGRTLANAGTGSWNSQRFILSNGAAVVNSGSFAIGSLDMYGEAGGGSFTNTTTGSITKTANASTAYIYDGVGFSNAGSVQVGNGTLWIDTPGTSSGSFDGAVNTTLVLYQQNLTATSRVSSAGTVGLTGTTVAGSYAVTGATDTGAVDFTGTVSSVGKLTVSGTTDFHGIAVSPSDLYLTGTLQSNAPITVAGTFAWSGGAMTGAGTTTVLAGGTLTGTGGHLRLSGRTLANAGTGSWNSQRFILSNGAAVVNSGSFAIGSLDMYGEAGGGSFTNTTTGSITKTANASTAYIYDGVGFSNAGSVQVGNGTLWIDTPGTSSGSFDGAVNTTLVLYQQNLTATSRVSSAGTVGLTGTTVAGSYAVTGATDTGAVDFTGTVSSVGKLTVSGTTSFIPAIGPQSLTIPELTVIGTLRGADDFLVTGSFNWSGGTLQGVAGLGSLTVLSNMTLNGTYSIRDFTLINAGDAVWSGGAVNFYGADSHFTNLSGATFEDRAGGHFGSADNNCPDFENQGLFRKTTATTTDLHMQLFNSGSVQVEQGSLNIDCGLVQVTTTTSGGSSSGTITGNFSGPVTTAVVNSGQVSSQPSPTPPPPVTNYTQTATGSLTELIGGLTPGTGYGQIVVNGNVSLAGTLSIVLTNGFSPHLNDTFTIIDNRGSNSVVGTFSGLPEGATVKIGSITYQISYQGGTGNDVVLAVISVNAPPTANAGGPYTVAEGGSVTLDGSGSSDPDQSAGTLTYTWDLDGDNVFGETGAAAGRGDEVGVNPTFSAAGLDGFAGAAVAVRLRVTDSAGASSDGSATVNITNANPIPVISSIGTVRVEGTSIAVTGSATDPAGANDTLTFAWAVYVGSSASAFATGGNGTSFSFTPTDNGSYRIVLTVSDEDGGAATTEQTIAVGNATPAAFNGGATTGTEGTSVLLTGSATDAGAIDQAAGFTYVWTVTRSRDGGATFSPYVVGSGAALTLNPNDDGLYRATLTATDKDGATSAPATHTIAVGNVTPSATVSGPTTGQVGIDFSVQVASASDPSSVDAAAGFTYQWSVLRCGTPVDLTGVATTGTTLNFRPTEPGAYTVTMTVTDKDGGATTASHLVTVGAPSGVTLLPGGLLVIVGTSCDDDIKVNPGGGAPEIKVKLNGVQSTYVGVTAIVVYAGAGDDLVQVAGGVTVPLTVFGGTGNDLLKAGGGNSILVGGDGCDVLLGGNGRDILIGGRGSDLIGGQGADDILIAGYTAFDGNLAALDLVRAEWSSARCFSDRVANLSGTGTTGVNGEAVLRATGPTATVFDDAACDLLAGGGGSDWFIFNSVGGPHVDLVADMSAFEGLFDTDL
ncbi:PKD domain-containing protein [Urbifossiella limnaea]|uniref:RTX-I toxin determinant A from serotypes 1/9 n=1 Tax=Urbifossiella limnaea TaxID=2528023 RepID=A0A517XUY7_9BACT|nr:PKD domain-containing protein [Urbifossiella limnaea]QDU21299.1 RTX-I toxin determinant A from serotypes 1/9 [Urbifossiella limnaea]